MPTYSKCKCQHCSGSIEFENQHVGRTTECPHCQMETVLYVVQIKPVKASRSKRTVLIILSIPLLFLVSMLALRSVDLSKAALAAGSFTTLMVLILGIMLTIFWLIFPWMVYFKMSRLEKILESIEKKQKI
jgi:NAD-dependent SIR2 family protein deacetylase